MTSQSYKAFGLCINSNFPLPFLSHGDAAADVTIRYLGQIEPLANPPRHQQIDWRQEGSTWIWNYRNPSGQLLRFCLRASGDYLSIYYSELEMADIFPCLMGPGLGAALYLQGIPLLHGAAVVIEGGAVVMAGQSDMGKSTLTAALVAAGLPLLTEELTVLNFSAADLLVPAGYPGLQLHADAVNGLAFSLKDCPPVYPGYPTDDKHWLDVRRLPGGFHPDPVPLRLIYLLSGRRPGLEAPLVTPLPPIQGCLALLEHLYGRRLLNIPHQQSLNLCALLAERVQVRRLWTPEGLHTVAGTVRVLIDDARSCVVSLPASQKRITSPDG